MRSTMQDLPLSVARLARYGTTAYPRSRVVTWTADGARSTTFEELGRTSAQLAHALRGLGVSGDQRAATLMFNNAEHMAAYIAVPSMGAVLHTLNLRLFPDQLVYIANHAEDRVILVDGAVLPLLARLLPEMKTVEHVVVTGPADLAPLESAAVQTHRWDDLLAGQPTEFDWEDPSDETDAAALCYTSGTTGNPRGVAYSHRSLWLHSLQVCLEFGLDDATRALVVVPMFHANAWGLPYAALMSGTDLLMPDRFLQAEPLARMIEAERPTFAAAVPTVWTDLLSHLDANGGRVSSLQDVLVGGSACPPALMTAFAERYGVRIIHGWGMTEISPLGAVARPPAGLAADERRRYARMQGRLPAGVEGRLTGPDGERVPHDGSSVGELEVRGPWTAGAYYGDEATDRFSPDGWLRTGDVGSLTPDLFLQLTDRAKDVIKSGGEWISSVELENALMGHPDVAEACVVGVPDERWGERPLAAVVPRAGAAPDADALREFLAGHVARWQLPERWAFVPEVPKTSVGKFDKKRLRRQHADGELDVVLLERPVDDT